MHSHDHDADTTPSRPRETPSPEHHQSDIAALAMEWQDALGNRGTDLALRRLRSPNSTSLADQPTQAQQEHPEMAPDNHYSLAHDERPQPLHSLPHTTTSSPAPSHIANNGATPPHNNLATNNDYYNAVHQEIENIILALQVSGRAGVDDAFEAFPGTTDWSGLAWALVGGTVAAAACFAGSAVFVVFALAEAGAIISAVGTMPTTKDDVKAFAKTNSIDNFVNNLENHKKTATNNLIRQVKQRRLSLQDASNYVYTSLLQDQFIKKGDGAYSLNASNVEALVKNEIIMRAVGTGSNWNHASGISRVQGTFQYYYKVTAPNGDPITDHHPNSWAYSLDSVALVTPSDPALRSIIIQTVESMANHGHLDVASLPIYKTITIYDGNATRMDNLGEDSLPVVRVNDRNEYSGTNIGNYTWSQMGLSTEQVGREIRDTAWQQSNRRPPSVSGNISTNPVNPP